jgi:AraC family transcriptional regulator, regulatory protein of adaptative response / methylated-DNA-[protein]-cysteine methyltransferase
VAASDARHHFVRMTMHMNPSETGATYLRIARAIRYLAEHYREQPSLEDAASAAALSPHHFQRLFTRYVGISPKAFVAALTLDRAKSALDDGASVLDAALEAGLSGPSRLHDLCLKIEAMTPGEYGRGGEGLAIEYGLHPSPFGTAIVVATRRGLCGLAFADEGDEDAVLADTKAHWPRAEFRHAPERAAPMARRIFEEGGDIALHLTGTPWQTKVWQSLLAIPPGRFATYGEIAQRLGAPSAARAVGGAVARNPIAWLIPCHRVLRSGGELGDYHWGPTRKRIFLALEAA